ncbi:MAG: TolC family protein [Chitinophagales bacterium]|nr:TolC family protein [Chitinophagales bacterium]
MTLKATGIYTMKNLIFLSLILISLYSKAQEQWDLEKCLRYAVENNLQIKNQEANEEIAKNNVLQSKANLFPTLNAAGSQSVNWGRTNDPTTFQFVTQSIMTGSYSLSSGIDIFTGLRNLNTIQQSKLQHQASHFTTEATKNSVLLSVTNSYLQILLANETLKSLQEQAAITQGQLERTQKLFQAGAIAEGGLLNIQSQLANDSLNIVTAQNNLDIAKLSLALLLQLDPNNFQVSVPELSDVIPPLDVQGAEGIFAYAVNNQPEIKSAEFSFRAAQKTLNVARGLNYPTLTLFGNLRSSYSSYEFLPFITKDPFFTQFGNNFNQTVGLQLSIPILNNLQTFTSVKNTKLQIQQAQYNNEAAKNQLKQDIYTAYADAKAASQRYYAFKKSVESLGVTFTYAETSFQLGANNALDYATAKSNLTIAQINLINAKYQYIFKLKVLDFYQGKPITLQ